MTLPEMVIAPVMAFRQMLIHPLAFDGSEGQRAALDRVSNGVCILHRQGTVQLEMKFNEMYLA
jgi:hypothetical protein